jgi:8-oxo-dGTP pyrophosphatase MutT (NUDIX family)
MAHNYYKGVQDLPFHLSVGAVVLNNQGQIAVHHFEHFRDLNDSRVALDDFYILMRGTLEPGETCEDALARELMEEFGAKAEIVTYLGSITAMIGPDRYIQKTTLYFQCKLSEIHDEWRDPHDEERDSVIEWHRAAFLIEKMRDQLHRYGMGDLDESSVIERIPKNEEPTA